jgi:hypothetical protein
MGRNARLRMTRDRHTLLEKRKGSLTAFNSNRWENPLILPKHGYTFVAEWLLGDCELARDLRKTAKARLSRIQDSDLVMPFEIVGKGQGVAFIQQNLISVDSWFDPVNRTDSTLKAFYNSQKFSDAIADMAGKLLINGKFITDTPAYFSFTA